MEVTKSNVTRQLLLGLAAAASMALVGCGGGVGDAISGFAGGSSSKDKNKKQSQKQIPSMVQSSTTSPPGATPTLEAPAPVSKAPATPVPTPEQPVQVASTGDTKPLREETQAYRAMRNRDPFRSLISSDQDRTDIVDLSVVTLVGIVWAQPSPFCIVEDTKGISYVLRKGDRVKNGRVVSVRRDKLIASQTILGYTTTVQLTLDKGKDKTHG